MIVIILFCLVQFLFTTNLPAQTTIDQQLVKLLTYTGKDTENFNLGHKICGNDAGEGTLKVINWDTGAKHLSPEPQGHRVPSFHCSKENFASATDRLVFIGCLVNLHHFLSPLRFFHLIFLLFHLFLSFFQVILRSALCILRKTHQFVFSAFPTPSLATLFLSSYPNFLWLAKTLALMLFSCASPLPFICSFINAHYPNFFVCPMQALRS